MAEEVVEIENLAVLGEDEVGLAMNLVRNDDNDASAPENVPEISDQGGAMHNTDWGHGFICQRLMTGTRKNPCFHFAPYIEPTKLQLFQLFFFRYLIKGVILHNINSRIDV